MPASPATWHDAFREWHDPQLSATRFAPVHWFERVDSTNRYALEQATRGVPEGLVAVADEQTAGRGRLGREWTAPPRASLLVSVLLRPQLAADRIHLVTLAAALAAVDAVDQLAGITAAIKWPNDVVVDDRKLAGILAEATSGAVVVGMGLNVRWEAFPPELQETATALNLSAGTRADRLETPAVLTAWLLAFEARLLRLDAVVDDARAHSATVGRRVRVELPNDTLTGIASALTDEGYLVVRLDDGSDRVVAAGDVVHLRLTG